MSKPKLGIGLRIEDPSLESPTLLRKIHADP